MFYFVNIQHDLEQIILECLTLYFFSKKAVDSYFSSLVFIQQKKNIPLCFPKRLEIYYMGIVRVQLDKSQHEDIWWHRLEILENIHNYNFHVPFND